MSKHYKAISVCVCAFMLVVFMRCSSTTAPHTETETPAPFFTGLGGSGMRLGILVPHSEGLNEDEAYLPDMVQGVLVTNISKYSAISVLDRVSLDRVIAETLDPTYEDNLDIVRLGHVTQVGYMMTGNIIRTSSGYSMQLNVTDTTPDAKTIASHSGAYTVEQFDNHSAIQHASLDLLMQMGVELTPTARNELGRASLQQSIKAQTAMARGITAQRRGQTVKAISHYYDASSLESIATEALNRLSFATASIATGSLGDQIRNDIQQRNEWISLIDETHRFFADNRFYDLAELHYSAKLDLAAIDYNKGTADLSFLVQVRLKTERAQAIARIISDIHNGLKATGKQQQWGISLSVDPLEYVYVFDFDLVDEKGRIVSSSTPQSPILLSFYDFYDIYFYDAVNEDTTVNTTLYVDYAVDTFLPGNRNRDGTLKRASYGGTYVSTGLFKVIKNCQFDVVGSLARQDILNLLKNNRLSEQSDEFAFAEWRREPFFTINAGDISDTLSIRLKNILIYRVDYDSYGRSAAVLVNQGRDVIPVFKGLI